MPKQSQINRCQLCHREIPKSPTRPRKFCDDGGVCKQAYYEAKRRLNLRLRDYPNMLLLTRSMRVLDRTWRDPVIAEAFSLELEAARAYRLGDRAERSRLRSQIKDHENKLRARDNELASRGGVSAAQS
jgi:hypothetical protein